MPTVELIYDKSCPNIEATRENLLRAFARLGLSPKWTEWEKTSPNSPTYVRDYGSPTILVDGKDCLGHTATSEAHSCRIYEGPNGNLGGIPSIELIASVITQRTYRHFGSRASIKWLSGTAVLLSVGATALANLACPACWPAYAGILSSLGLGFLAGSRHLFILTSAFLIIALGALGYRARTRRGYAPLTLGIIGAATIMAGKFLFELNPIMYVGVAFLVGASLWNSWPRTAGKIGSCPSCDETGATSALSKTDRTARHKKIK